MNNKNFQIESSLFRIFCGLCTIVLGGFLFIHNHSYLDATIDMDIFSLIFAIFGLFLALFSSSRSVLVEKDVIFYKCSNLVFRRVVKYIKSDIVSISINGVEKENSFQTLLKSFIYPEVLFLEKGMVHSSFVLRNGSTIPFIRFPKELSREEKAFMYSDNTSDYVTDLKPYRHILDYFIELLAKKENTLKLKLVKDLSIHLNIPLQTEP